jgi:DNA-3-methyladenine glycosylase II
MESARQLWKLKSRPTPVQLARRAKAWSPHRATAARLLWHHYLSEKAKR